MEIGDILRGSELGKTGRSGRGLFRYQECPKCNKTRWVFLSRINEPPTKLCRACAIERAKRIFSFPSKNK